MAFFNQFPTFPRDLASTERYARGRDDFIPSGWILLLVVAVVAGLFYLALAARLADTTVVLSGSARPNSPPLVIGEETRPTQAPIR